MYSVIIPLYNKAPYIQRAIDSILNQEFKDYEIIVIDDGSTDGGGELVDKLYGNKIKLIHQENSGVSAARNRGIQEAKYPWIAFLDADDYWHPLYLSFTARTISENPDIGIIGTHYDSHKLSENPELKYYALKDYFKKAIKNTYFFTSATMVKNDFFLNNPGFDPQLKLGEDIDVWLRASLFFGDGIYIQNTLVYYGNEDKNRATQQAYEFKQTLIPKILQNDYYDGSKLSSTCSKKEFEAFRDIWIYSTLYPHYKVKKNITDIQRVLAQMKSRYFLVRGIYKLPYKFQRDLFANPSFSRFFRNYLKFCFRYIYV